MPVSSYRRDDDERSRSNLRHLVAPPRTVPLPVRSSALFGGFLSQFGWLWLLIAITVFWAFALHSDVTSWFRFRGALQLTTGVVTDVRETSTTVNHRRVYAYHYAFNVQDDSRHQGVSYAGPRDLGPGTTVFIEHPRGNPGDSRIQGMRTATLDSWIGLIGLPFVLVGIGLVTAALICGLKANRLLGQGRLAFALLQSKEPTSMRVNGQPVYRLTFSFKAEDGRTYTVKANTHTPARLEDEEMEPVLYDPRRPRSAVLIDNLPGSPRVTEQGQLQAAGYARGLLVAIAPLLTIVGHGSYALIRQG
jgi:hypothetical protein